MTVTISGSSGITGPNTDNDVVLNGVTVGLGGGSLSSNTVVGASALQANTTASNSTAIGYQALYSQTTSGPNTAVGYQASFSSSSNNGNTTVGYKAGYGTTSGSVDAFGYQTLYSNTTGINNVAFGNQALQANTTASYNTAVGYQAGYAVTTGANNFIAGYQAGNAITTGIQNTVLGAQSGQTLTTGQDNVYIGYRTVYNATSTGSYNVALGNQSLYSNTTASNNTAVGYQAGYTISTGTNNAIFGNVAGKLGNGTYNTFIGDTAGYNTSGTLNALIGQGAGYLITSGSYNTVLGSYSGNQGGLDIRTSSNNIVLSDGAGYPYGYYDGVNARWQFGLGGTGTQQYGGQLNLNASNASGWGPLYRGLANSSLVWSVGSYSVIVSGANQYLTCQNTSGGVYLNGSSATSWSAVSSDVREKKDFAPVEGLTQLLQVVPTKYRYTWEDESHPIHMGFTAQNLQPLIPDMVVTRDEKAEDGTNLLTVTMDYMIPVLVQSIKDLNAIVTAQATEIASLKAKVGI
jgi:Chaperone of endosialidase